jgi:LmeA-like phospholipid-binding
VSYNPYVSDDAAPRRRRRGGCLRTAIIGVVVLVILLVAADFIAKAVAQNVAASQIQKDGFPKKPSVTFEGFPFLTQVAAHDFHQVRLSSSDVPAGPVDITKVNAVANGIHLKGNFQSGTIDQVSGTVVISFGSLDSALTNALGPAGSVVGSVGLKLSAAGPQEIKASLDLVVASGSATWRVTRPTPQELSVTLVSSSGLPASLLQPIRNFSFTIPKLPFGLTIRTVSVTPSGIVGNISATHVPFSQ